MKKGKGLALICAAGVIWGTIGPAVDLVHERSGLSSLTMSLWRSIFAVLALVVMVLTRGQLGACVALVRARPGRVVAMGVLTGSFQLLFFVSVLAVGVSVATVVALGFAPVFLLVLHGVQSRVKPSGVQSATVAIAVTGLLLISLGGDIGGSAPALGVLTALACGTAYAVSTDVGSSVSAAHDAVPVAMATMVVAAVFLVTVGLVGGLARGDALVPVDAATWAGLGYLGAVTMALAYVFLFAALRTLPTASAAVATLLEPVTAVIIAVLLLGETLTDAGVVGSLMIVAAIGSLALTPQVPDVPEMH